VRNVKDYEEVLTYATLMLVKGITLQILQNEDTTDDNGVKNKRFHPQLRNVFRD
jgi:hypothetical protein